MPSICGEHLMRSICELVLAKNLFGTPVANIIAECLKAAPGGAGKHRKWWAYCAIGKKFRLIDAGQVLGCCP